MFTIIILLSFQFNSAFKYENNCGCSANSRLQGKSNNNKIEDIWSNFYRDSPKQCPLRTTENLYTKIPDNKKENNMIFLPAGEYQMGTDDIILEGDKEGPKRMVKLNSFYLDKYEVSNSDFKDFVLETNYKTEAETFGDSFVFSLFLNSTMKKQLVDFRVAQAPWWYKVSGANWKHPHGPDSDIKEYMDHPVIHVSWRDAQEYCKWRHARLPTEAEWEAACRGGKQDVDFPWGNKLFPDKKHMANIWQGTFPNHNSLKDGYIGTNPVDLFEQNSLGFYNLAGNVWEWTKDAWSEDKPMEKVKKGGSYLCHKKYCYRYRCSARSQNTEDSTAGNLGFRCAKTP